MQVTEAHAFEQSYRAHRSVKDDPFYTVPAESGDAPAGTLLKMERETDTSLYTLAPNLSLSRFIYQSKTSKGAKVPVSAYVLWPYAARPHREGIPMVIWAHGTSGNSAECAPSNIQNLWHHFQTPYQLALYGYVVVATDYAGLGVGKDALGNEIIHEYLTGSAQANDIYYSIFAAREAFPELSEEFVVIGASQGGGAAWSFAEKLVDEPMLGHLGTIALSPNANLGDLSLDTPVMPFILLCLAPTLKKNYGDFNPEDIFTPKGMQSLATLDELQGCTTTILQILAPGLLKPGWENNKAVLEYQRVAANGLREISGPMLVIQGDAAFTPAIDAAIKGTVEKFPNSNIESHLLPNVTHAPVMYAAMPIYVDWIAARFAGKPVVPGYHRLVANPARPAACQQAGANWFIQKQQFPYQQT